MYLPISRAEQLEAKIKSLEDELTKSRDSLSLLRKTCRHSWTPTHFYPGETREEKEPEYLSRYYGDNWPKGRSMLIPIPPKWVRKCVNCGKFEQTSKTKLVKNTNTGLHQEQPFFEEQ